MAAFLIGSLLFNPTGLKAQDSQKNVDDLYIEVYNTILGADEAWQMGKKRDAYELYQKAQGFLENIKKEFPDWNKKLVDFRLSYVKTKMQQFDPPTAVDTPPKSPTERVPENASDAEKEIRALKTQLAQLEKIRDDLDARLREATSAQPANVDPRELQKAEKTIAELTQTNALLKIQLADLSKNLTPDEPEGKPLSSREIKRLDKAREEIKKLDAQLSTLKEENSSLRKEVKKQDKSPESSDSSANVQIQTLEKEIVTVRAENERLSAQLKTFLSVAPGDKGQETEKLLLQQEKLVAEMTQTIETLRAENEALKAAADLSKKESQQAVESTLSRYEAVAAELAQLKLSSNQMELELQKSKEAAATNSLPDPSELNSLQRQVGDLEKMVDGLKEENKVLRDAATRKGESKLLDNIDRLRSKIAVYERAKEPYTPEELALMRPGKPIRVGAVLDSQVTLSTGEPARGSAVGSSLRHSAPADGKEIAAEGVKEFSEGRMNEAERLFQRLLSLDENSVYTLGNLGAAQLELGKLKEAEINLKKAYSLGPQDTFVINLLAILNLKNRKIDDAFELLSTSAKIDPNNAETQNYLGMVLGERGLRTDAEKSFRAALKVNPRYSVAHYNLAVLYATTKPAYPQLANYHYQKAVSLGASTNPDFEKLLQTALEESQAPEKEAATE